MADGLNRVMLLGSLGADPEVRVTQGGATVMNLRIATNSSYLDRDKVRQERTDWHSCVMFGRRAESLARYLTKGSQVYVEGSLRTESWEKDGEKRYATKVYLDNLIFAGGRGGGGGGRSEDDGGYGGDDRGQGQSRGGGGGGRQRQSAPRDDDGYGPPAGGGGGGGYAPRGGGGGGHGGGGGGGHRRESDPVVEPGFSDTTAADAAFGGDDDIPFLSAQFRWWKP